MTNPKYQIFVSSTYEDLKGVRDQIIRVALEMGHIPVGMEMFSAADEEQWKIIARHIDESDYYVVIVAHRLGSLTPEKISYTRKEYEYAAKKGVPILGFMIDDAAAWPPDQVEKLDAARHALDDFKELVRRRPVSFWSGEEDLPGKFSIALGKAITTNPRPGWVRATGDVSTEVTGELTRLSRENAVLRAELGAARKDAAEDEHAEMRKAIDVMMKRKSSPSYRYSKGGEWNEDVEVSLFNIFLHIGTELAVEASVEELSSTLAMQIRKDTERSWDVVAINQVKSMLVDLMTLDLVKVSTRKHPVADTNEYWTLSEFGDKCLRETRKVFLSMESPIFPQPADEEAADEDSGAAVAHGDDN